MHAWDFFNAFHRFTNTSAMRVWFPVPEESSMKEKANKDRSVSLAGNVAKQFMRISPADEK